MSLDVKKARSKVWLVVFEQKLYEVYTQDFVWGLNASSNAWPMDQQVLKNQTKVWLFLDAKQHGEM